jgi:hypothetical protein
MTNYRLIPNSVRGSNGMMGKIEGKGDLEIEFAGADRPTLYAMKGVFVVMCQYDWKHVHYL